MDATRRPDIQGLRALAVMAVMAFHARLPVPGGFVGVDVFFVISGFVITAMLMREHQATGRVSLGRFYWRRFKRLTPALSTVLIVGLLLAIPLLSPFGQQQAAADTAIAAILLVANLQIARTTSDYFGDSAEDNLFLNTWSLSVEEQFYIFFPALIAVVWLIARRRTARSRAVVVSLALVGAVSFTLAVLGSTGYSLPRFFWILGFYSPLTRVWEFAAGALLAMAVSRLRTNPLMGQVAGIGGLGLILVSLWVISAETPFPGVWTLLPVAGTLLVIAAGSLSPSNVVAQGLSVRPACIVGDYSYSLYLWHWPFIVLGVATLGNSTAVATAAVLASVLPATISYRLIERPLRGFNITRMALRVALVVACVVGPIAVAVFVKIGAQATWGAPLPDRPVFGSGGIGLADCMRFARSESSSPLFDAKCQFGARSTGEPVYLVGDSQAAQWAEGVDAAARSLDRPALVATAPGCPFLDVFLASPSGAGPDDQACRENYEATLEVLRSSQPGVVVLGQSMNYWTDPDVVVSVDREPLANDPADKAKAFAAGLARTVRDLEASGHRVVVVIPTYRLIEDPYQLLPTSCSTITLLKGECFAPVTEASIDEAQVFARKTLVRASQSLGLETIDPGPFQCPDGQCGLWNGGIPIYSDGTHVSGELSRSLSPVITRVLMSAPHAAIS